MAKRPPELSFQDDTALQGPNANALIAAMKAAHTKDARINVIYGRLKQEGYGKIDQEVNALRAAGIHPQITLMGTPEYLPQTDQTINRVNNRPQDWQQFAGEVAQHFKGRVGRYSVGNEMNLPGFFAANEKGARAGGRAYRDVYRAGQAGIRAADRSAQVLMGEMVGADNARDFLKGALGGKGLRTSGLAYHPYDAWITGRQAASKNSWDINSLGSLQHTLASYARQGKLRTAEGKAAPLYLTEMGYFRGGKLSDQQRAGMMAQAYRKAQQAGARQFTSYQMAPTVRRSVEGAPSADVEGGLIPGQVTQSPDWVWDTTLAPQTLAQSIRRLQKRTPVARAAARR